MIHGLFHFTCDFPKCHEAVDDEENILPGMWVRINEKIFCEKHEVVLGGSVRIAWVGCPEKLQLEEVPTGTVSGTCEFPGCKNLALHQYAIQCKHRVCEQHQIAKTTRGFGCRVCWEQGQRRYEDYMNTYCPEPNSPITAEDHKTCGRMDTQYNSW